MRTCWRSVLVVLTVLAIAQAVIAEGPVLVAHYKFDGGGGTDSSANGLDATVHGAQLEPGTSRGDVLHMDGRDDWVSVPSSELLDLEEYTLAVWIYRFCRCGANYQSLIQKPQSYVLQQRPWQGTQADTGPIIAGGRFGGCAEGDITVLTSTTNVPLDRWTHVASVYDGEELRIYLNGVEAGSTAVSGEPCKNDEPVTLGAIEGGGSLNYFGYYDDARIYSRALTPEELQTVMDGGEIPEEPGGTVGDATGDGRVDIWDLVIVAQNFGMTSGFDVRADINGDGRVDIYDLVVIAQNFGRTG
jgi:hypothetical protein